MMDIDLTKDQFETKYRNYRWTLEIEGNGIPAFTIARIALTRNMLTVWHHYANDMDLDKSPLPDGEGTFILRMLSADGTAIKLGNGCYRSHTGLPFDSLDYTAAGSVLGVVYLHNVAIRWTNP